MATGELVEGVAQRARPGLRTFKQFCVDTGLSEGSLRWLIFNEQKYGLEKAGAVIRFHGKIFIDADRFLAHVRGERADAAVTNAPKSRSGLHNARKGG